MSAKSDKRDVVFIIYVPNQGWYTGDDYTPNIDEAWSTTDRGVAQSYANLYGGTVYTRHFSYSIGPVNNGSRFA